jgi:uncharacterized membrane protein
MLNLIFALTFVHVVAAAVMFGAWLCLAAFMLFAHASGNTAVIALTARFVVRVEMALMAPAVMLQPISGFPLAWAIGLSPLDEFWIVLSIIIYAAVAATWLANFGIELRVRKLAREAAVRAAPLPKTYRRLFRIWAGLAVPILAGMLALIALMIWQPHDAAATMMLNRFL